jgi:hypothetical protein
VEVPFKEAEMNQDVFNISVRQFLKRVGVTSQRAIEQAVREAVAQGGLQGNETLPAQMTLTLGRTSLNFSIDGEIKLE